MRTFKERVDREREDNDVMKIRTLVPNKYPQNTRNVMKTRKTQRLHISRKVFFFFHP